MLLAWAGLALGLSIILFVLANRNRASTQLPHGRVIYQDRRGFVGVPQVLFDGVSGLSGKPDYVVKHGRGMIPVEVKTGRTPAEPYEGHIMQLAAYCLLVERHYGRRPSHGILQYPQRTFAVDFTPALEEALLDLLEEMRADAGKRLLPRSHEEAPRCRSCGYRDDCEERLL